MFKIYKINYHQIKHLLLLTNGKIDILQQKNEIFGRNLCKWKFFVHFSIFIYVNSGQTWASKYSRPIIVTYRFQDSRTYTWTQFWIFERRRFIHLMPRVRLEKHNPSVCTLAPRPFLIGKNRVLLRASCKSRLSQPKKPKIKNKRPSKP